jgi:hypothetical protein
MIEPVRFPFISVNSEMGEVGQFEPVQLVFDWTKATGIPFLLGQVNFFIEFDICFHRSQLNFEVSPKNSD